MIGLTALGIRAWICPLHALTGVPCPGCGMTRALAALLRWDLRAAWELHPFSPLALGFALLIGAALLLPEPPRRRLIAWVERVEGRTHGPLWLLVAFTLFGALRALRTLLA